MPDKNRIVCLLKESFLFGVLTEGELQEIVTDGRSSAAVYHAGESIYTDKSFKKALGTVISARVSIYRAGNGSRVLLNKIEAGGIFGAASLFGASDLYVTGIFAETDAEIFFVSGELFEEIVSANSAFALAYIRFLSDRIRFLNRRISELSASGAERRFAKYLSECKKNPAPNMKQLASFLGIGRASLYRMIDSFTENGLIEKDGKEIIIKNPEALKKLL